MAWELTKIKRHSALSVDEIAPSPGSLGAKQSSQRNLRFFGGGGAGFAGIGTSSSFHAETRKATITACTATIAATPAYTMRSAGFATSGSRTMKATVIVASGTTNIAVVKRRKRWNDATLAGSLRWRRAVGAAQFLGARVACRIARA